GVRRKRSAQAEQEGGKERPAGRHAVTGSDGWTHDASMIAAAKAREPGVMVLQRMTSSASRPHNRMPFVRCTPAIGALMSATRYTTANGESVPMIGFGTSQLGACADIVATAIELGYRHIDTAWKYGT